MVIKRHLILFLFFIPVFCYGQGLNFKKSLAEALFEAKRVDKKVLVIIYPRGLFYTDGKTVLENEETVKKLNQNFILYQTIYSDSSLSSFVKYYAVKDCPNFLFLHNTMELFYRSLEYNASPKRFGDILETALTIAKQPTLASLNQTYLTDTTNIKSLKALIDARKAVGITNNAYHIEKYANFLKDNELKDYNTVLYLLEGGPIINRVAYRKAFKNKSIIDSIFKHEQKAKCAELLTIISNNTMEIAIATKCLNDALNNANYHKSQWRNDIYSGQKIYNEKMLQYYYAINDTTNYFSLAIPHFDTYYMAMKVDSIQKNLQKEKFERNSLTPGWKAKSFPEGLNNVALNIYKSRTKNIVYLQKAINWSERAIKIEQKAIYYDTMAHLQYQAGNFDKAIYYQEVAVKYANAEKIKVQPF